MQVKMMQVHLLQALGHRLDGSPLLGDEQDSLAAGRSGSDDVRDPAPSVRMAFLILWECPVQPWRCRSTGTACDRG